MHDLVSVDPKEAVLLGSTSTVAFGKLFLPKTFRQDSAPFHDELSAALNTIYRYTVVEVFRGGAKTSFLRVFTLQRIAYGISRTIMYVSISQAHAVSSVRWLKKQIQFNTKFAQAFNLRPGSKWTDEVIEIYHGIDETPITVLAMGITGQIRGFNIDDYRPDLIVADDVVNEENSATKQQQEKLAALFFGGLVNSLAPATECPTAKVVLLQTPLDRKDLAETCMNDPQWHGIRFGILDENNRSRWEARFPTKTVLEEKQAAIARRQYSLWMREMECKIVASEDKHFDISRLQFWDVVPDGGFCLLCIDPASSDSPDADENVVMALYFYGAQVYVLDYHNARGVMPDEVANRFFEYTMQYRPRKAAVEIVSYQRVLKWYLEQEMVKRRIFVAIDPIQEKRSKPDRILQTLGGLVHMGLLYVKPHMVDLIEQLDRYNPEDRTALVDIIDCLAIGVTASNPALRDIEAEYEQLDDEDYAEMKVVNRCP